LATIYVGEGKLRTETVGRQLKTITKIVPVIAQQTCSWAENLKKNHNHKIFLPQTSSLSTFQMHSNHEY